MPDMATIFIRNQIKKTKNNVPFGNRGGSVGQSRADLGSWLFGRWLQYGVFCLNLKGVSMIPFSVNVSVLIQLGISTMRQPLAACRTVHCGSPETSYRWRSRQALPVSWRKQVIARCWHWKFLVSFWNNHSNSFTKRAFNIWIHFVVMAQN